MTRITAAAWACASIAAGAIGCAKDVRPVSSGGPGTSYEGTDPFRCYEERPAATTAATPADTTPAQATRFLAGAAHRGRVSVATSRDGAWIASSDETGTLAVARAATNEVVWTAAGSGATFSDDGALVAFVDGGDLVVGESVSGRTRAKHALISANPLGATGPHGYTLVWSEDAHAICGSEQARAARVVSFGEVMPRRGMMGFDRSASDQPNDRAGAQIIRA